MQAEHLRGTAGDSAELRDRDGGRVARQHGLRPAQQAQLPEEVAFECGVLRDGFDDERDLIEIPQAAHRPETLQDRVHLIGLHCPFFHGSVQPLPNPAQRTLERLRLGVEQPDVPPAGGSDLGDTAPHLAGAQHPNPRNITQHHGLLSTTIANASPPPMQRLANPRRAPRASIGLSPRRSASSSAMTTSAAAPSLQDGELPTVSNPSSWNTGFRERILLRSTRFGSSSSVTMSGGPLFWGTSTPTISRLKAPEAIASRARPELSSAQSS